MNELCYCTMSDLSNSFNISGRTYDSVTVFPLNEGARSQALSMTRVKSRVRVKMSRSDATKRERVYKVAGSLTAPTGPSDGDYQTGALSLPSI